MFTFSNCYKSSSRNKLSSNESSTLIMLRRAGAIHVTYCV